MTEQSEYRRCADCGTPTHYLDPRYGCPCCAACLRELYGEPEAVMVTRAQDEPR